jgi:glycosyltransferase involved in cell wall biosynthesis
MTSERPKVKKTAWITWEIQVRNRSMSAALSVPLYELTSDLPRLLKYPVLLFKTCCILVKTKADILFVQNPSIVLSFLAICAKPILRLTVIVDAHNSGIFPLEGRNQVLNTIAKFIVSQSDYTIITNRFLAKIVKSWGGNPIIMPDPIPDFSAHKIVPFIPKKPYVYFICTWADDEPFDEVFKAASRLKANVDVYVTGNYKKKLDADAVASIPGNVKLLGFLSEDDYLNYFAGASLILDLTTRENCLVCGAYEALALKRPAIISDSIVSRELFKAGFLYTQNSAESISQTIEAGFKRLPSLQLEMLTAAPDVDATTQKVRADLMAKIGLNV